MPPRLKANTVTDEQGRQRFHGAFTGGFSAGYFNTVGSAEGFKPAQFVSSRSNRAGKVSRPVTDYMDAEDGLLSGRLSTKGGLDSFIAPNQSSQASDDPILAKLMKQFVAEPTNTIGKKLLAQLGWKPGMAIGPRKKKANYFDDAEVAKMVLQSGKIPVSSLENGQLTFIQRYEGDLVPKKIKPWIGSRGVGYDPSTDPSHRSLHQQGIEDISDDELMNDSSSSSNRYHMKDVLTGNQVKAGSIPRVDNNRTKVKTAKSTAYLDDDDDIAFDYDDDRSHLYSKEVQEDDLDTFSSSVTNTNQQFKENRQFHNQQPSLQRCPIDDKPVLPGFVLAKKKTSFQILDFPPPEVPRDFRPRPHLLFTQNSNSILNNNAAKSTLTNVPSGSLIVEQSTDSTKPSLVKEPAASKPSVFDLLKPADRERILQLAKQTHAVVTAQNNDAKVSSSSSSSSSSSNNNINDIHAQPAEALSAAAAALIQGPDPSASSEGSRPMLVPPALLQHSQFASFAASFKSRFTSASEATLHSQQQAGEAAQAQAGMLSAEAFKAKQQQQQQQQMALAQRDQQQSVSTVSSLPVCKPKRSEIPWVPSALLCKRMHLKQPVLAASSIDAREQQHPVANSNNNSNMPSSRQQQSAAGDADLSEAQRLKFQQEDVYLQPATTAIAVIAAANATNASSNVSKEGATATVAAVSGKTTAVMKPFRSIFEDSEDEEEEEEEEETEKEEKIDDSNTEIKDAMVAPSSVVKVSLQPVQASVHDTASVSEACLEPPTTTTTTVSAAPSAPSLPTFIPRSQRILSSTITTTTSAAVSTSMPKKRPFQKLSFGDEEDGDNEEVQDAPSVSFKRKTTSVRLQDNNNKESESETLADRQPLRSETQQTAEETEDTGDTLSQLRKRRLPPQQPLFVGAGTLARPSTKKRFRTTAIVVSHDQQEEDIEQV